MNKADIYKPEDLEVLKSVCPNEECKASSGEKCKESLVKDAQGNVMTYVTLENAFHAERFAQAVKDAANLANCAKPEDIDSTVQIENVAAGIQMFVFAAHDFRDALNTFVESVTKEDADKAAALKGLVEETTDCSKRVEESVRVVLNALKKAEADLASKSHEPVNF